MPYVPYNKPYKKPADLVADLKSKNLSFLDEAAAEDILSQISYYHFKIYLYPLLDPHSPGGKNYRNNEYFEDGVDLYRFDENMRFILFKAIARIEVKLRSRIDHTISALSNNPFWYLDNHWFYTPNNNTYTIDSIRSRINNEFSNTKEEYAKHYKENYYNDTHHNYKSLPPFWIASELLSIGAISKIYNAIDFSIINAMPGAPLNTMAAEFGAPNYRTLCTWIKVLRDVRNRCAHHSRLWSANLPASPNIGSLITIPPLNNNRLYSALIVIHHMLRTLGISDLNIYDEITKIIGSHMSVRPYLRIAGFVSNWHTDPFWS
ncbi:TPA: Abi family protein [Klebsiella michiganensis]|nr:Abi family protein [Klebsiella michiganensis]